MKNLEQENLGLTLLYNSKLVSFFHFTPNILILNTLHPILLILDILHPKLSSLSCVNPINDNFSKINCIEDSTIEGQCAENRQKVLVIVTKIKYIVINL